MAIQFDPIGTIHSPFDTPEGMPIQPAAAEGVMGSVHVFEEYLDGLKDLEGFSHIILIYHFHRSEGYELVVTPFLDTERRGVFATRAPRRPNAIGLSIVGLDKVADGELRIRNVDVLDGTPLLDIKPYVPRFDVQVAPRSGWLERNQDRAPSTRADDRFTQSDRP